MKPIRPAIWLASLALGAAICAAPVRARSQSQSMTSQDQDSGLNREQLSTFDQFLDSHPELAEQIRNNPSVVNNEEFVEAHPDLQQYLQAHPEVREQLNNNPSAVIHQERRFDRNEDRDQDRNRDRDRNGSDINRTELTNMDRFMDSHPEIAEQVRKNPSLVNNKEFVEDHPALQQFLAEHPGVRDEMRENPNAFMNRENSFDQRQDGRDRDRDLTRGELVNMDRFMDAHPEIAEQLHKNPSLVNDKEFVEHHQALKDFLAQHPGVRQEMQENPNVFMARENSFDQRQDTRDRDMNRGQMATMDRFMDSHPEIAEQLRRNPALVNKKDFVEDHPALQQFLSAHPELREDFKENPSAFMNREQRFDNREGFGMRRDGDVTNRELSSFNGFLEGHSQIAGEISKNPTLATNQEYLENHPELRDYLKAHPQVHEELKENPQSFLKSTQQFGTTTKTPATPKLK